MDKRDYILSLFHLYTGEEKDLAENPIPRGNGFKRYIWFIEYQFLWQYDNKRLEDLKTDEELKKEYDLLIEAGIMKFAYPLGEEEIKKLQGLYNSFTR